MECRGTTLKLFTIMLLLTIFAHPETIGGLNAVETQSVHEAQSATQSVSAIPGPVDINRLERMLQDWADLNHYRSANAALEPPSARENRVVFMGDSITEYWGRRGGAFFPGESYINRGISGQTTPQMLVRFWPDVIALKPKVVVILGGTNDIAGNTGPSTPRMIEDNLMAMTELAQANHIRVVLASILPTTKYPWRPSIDPVAEIRALNDWIRSFCKISDSVYLDYYSAMANTDGSMKANLTLDGVHPNRAGYEVMAPRAEKAIAEALTSQTAESR